jgi:hypothetical protein
VRILPQNGNKRYLRFQWLNTAGKPNRFALQPDSRSIGWQTTCFQFQGIEAQRRVLREEGNVTAGIDNLRILGQAFEAASTLKPLSPTQIEKPAAKRSIPYRNIHDGSAPVAVLTYAG